MSKNPLTLKKAPLLPILGSILSVASLTTPAFATNYYWDTNGTTAGSGVATGTWGGVGDSGFFSTSSAGTDPTSTVTTTSGDNLTFSAGSNGTAGTVTLSGAQTIGNLTINQSGLIFSGDALSLNTGGNQGIIANQSVVFNNSINGSVVVAAGKTAEFTGGGTFTDLRGDGTINFSAGTANVSDALLGDGNPPQISVTGTATYNSTYTGGTFLGYANAATFTYNSSSTTSHFAGSNLYLGRLSSAVSGNPLTTSLTVQNGKLTIDGTLNIGYSNQYATSLVTVEGGTLDVGTRTTIVGYYNTDTNAGTNTLTVSGGTFNTGNLTLRAGTAGGTSTVNLSAGVLNVDTLAITGTGSNTINISGGTIGTNTFTSATWAAPITLSGNANIRAANAGGTSADITLSGVLSGTGGFTKTGAGALILSNTNTFSGASVVSAGKLTLTSTAHLNNLTSLSINAGTLEINNATSLSDTINLSLANGTTFTFGTVTGSTETIGSLVLGTYQVPAGTWSATDLAGFNSNITYNFGSGNLITVAVPEPTTWGAVVFGLGVLAIIKRRRLHRLQ